MRQRAIQILTVALSMVLASCGGGGGVTPPPVTDTTPPTISRVAVEPSTLIVPGTSEVRVEADVTDDTSGVASVTVQVVYPDGATENRSLSATSGQTYAVQFTASWSGSQPGTLRFTVSATDGAGNSQSASPVERRGASPPPGNPW